MTRAKLAKLLLLALSLFALSIVAVFVYYYFPYKLEHLGNTEKIWAHRVNSMEKQKYTQNKYTGIEVDVVYDTTSNTFDVTHPPVPSIGLILEKYFNELESDKGLWLDFKNLKEHNKTASLNRLLEITEQYGIPKANIRVESHNPQYLQPFLEAGFQTSYYLPPHLHTLAEADLNEKIEEIKNAMEQFYTTTISTNVEDYEIIASHFPEKNKLLWSLFTTYNKRMFPNYLLTRSALKDPTVKVLLVRVNKRVGHR